MTYLDNDTDLDIVTSRLIFYNERIPAAIPDHIPPTLAIVEPADQSIICEWQQHIEIRYSDADAGVDVRSLQVFVNKIDRTNELTIEFDRAYGDDWMTSPLEAKNRWFQEGRNRIHAQVKDNRGNLASATAVFQVNKNVIPFESKLKAFNAAGIERAEFAQGEPVTFRIILSNRTGGSQQLTFVDSWQFNIHVGELWQPRKFAATAFTYVVIPPLQTHTWQMKWDGRDSRGLLVLTGTYPVRGEITYAGRKVHPEKGIQPVPIHITIIPCQKPSLFTDVTRQAMPQEVQDELFPHTILSGKSAVWGDFDRDSQLELLAVNYTSNYLYHNQEDGTFIRMTPVGLDTAVEYLDNALPADYDDDGDLDICIIRHGRKDERYILLYRNEGRLRFTDVTDSAFSHQLDSRCDAVWGDFNNDGHPDLFAATESGSHALYQNNGDGTFTNVIQQTGIQSPRASQTLVIAVDYDNDGNLDLHLLSGSARRNQLYRNNGNSTFTDVTEVSGLYTLNHKEWRIKYAWGDLNGDGFPDVIAWDSLAGMQLHFNNGDATFRDASANSGLTGIPYKDIAYKDITLVDYDKDGALDIYLFSRLFRNRGDGTFIEVVDGAGITSIKDAHRAAFADYDGDGDLDLYLVRSGYKNLLFRQNRQ